MSDNEYDPFEDAITHVLKRRGGKISFADLRHKEFGPRFVPVLSEITNTIKEMKKRGIVVYAEPLNDQTIILLADMKEEAMAWLNKNWQGQKICPICQNNNWTISDSLVEVRQFVGGGLKIQGPVYPLFLITCGVCGYSMFFNAVVAGIMPGEPTQPQELSISLERNKERG